MTDPKPDPNPEIDVDPDADADGEAVDAPDEAPKNDTVVEPEEE